ncbi:hypothetical protein [Burkholderia metallica]|nr:hypothetical protein [Burkholderia metallica]
MSEFSNQIIPASQQHGIQESPLKLAMACSPDPVALRKPKLFKKRGNIS